MKAFLQQHAAKKTERMWSDDVDRLSQNHNC